MANKIPTLGDFTIPSEVFDYHEWMSDSFIDGETGSNCSLNYLPKRESCDNCIFDTNTNCSSNIYNGTGPISFANFNICPRCQGNGYLEIAQTETIRLRVYWDVSSWRTLGIKAVLPETFCYIIGYMSDLPKVEKADSILLNSDLEEMRKYLCVTNGEPLPYGFRRNRYFVQQMKRVGGGG